MRKFFTVKGAAVGFSSITKSPGEDLTVTCGSGTVVVLVNVCVLEPLVTVAEKVALPVADTVQVTARALS